MDRTLIANARPGEMQRLQGFVENIRNKRTMAFLVLRDHTCRIQLTVEKEKYPEVAAGNDLIRVAVQKVGIPLPEAIRMMTENPAKILGIDHQKGHIREGFDADLMLFDENIDVCSVFYAGKEVIG